MAEAVQPLTDAAKQFLAGRYKDVTKWAACHLDSVFFLIDSFGFFLFI